MVNYDDYTAADYDPAARQAKIRKLGYTGDFGGGAADNWLKTNYGSTKVANLTNSGVKPLTKASMNDYQKTALYGMGKQNTAIDPNIAKTYDKAGASIGKAANTSYDPMSYKTFMNPYIDEVINRNAATIGRTYNAKRNDINQSFAEAGGYGSTAQGVERSLNNEAEARQIADMDAQLRAAGYDTATDRSLGLYETDVNKAMKEASAYSDLAGKYAGMDEYTRGVLRNALLDKLSAGERIQQDQQGELDAYYTEKQAAENYTPQQIAFLQSILGAYPTGSTTTTTQPGVGTMQGALGGASLGNAMYNSWINKDTPWRSPQTMNSAGRDFYGV